MKIMISKTKEKLIMNEQIRKINSLGLVISPFCVSQSALEHSPLHATPLLHLPPIPNGINHTSQKPH